MPKLNTTTSGIITSVFTADGSSSLELQENGVPVQSYGKIPAFSAYISATQSIGAATTTKVQFNTENFDTASF